MAIETEFDPPPEKDEVCKGCGQPMRSKPFWTGRTWIYPTAHAGCEEKYYMVNVSAKTKVPERFREFEEIKFRDREALEAATRFTPSCGFRTLALIGNPAKGKSRLMWHIVGRFMDQLKAMGKVRNLEYWLFADLVTEIDRHEIAKVKSVGFAFIDDIGATEAYGRPKSDLQDAIRTRVQKGLWTFLTIDDPRFDPGFKDVFRERAVEIYVEE